MRRAPWSGRLPVDEAEARRRIKEAAVRCLERCGIEGTSLSVIAAEAGVSRPTLYAYFSSRDEIVDAANLEATASFVDRVGAMPGSSRRPASGWSRPRCSVCTVSGTNRSWPCASAGTG